MSFGNNPFTPSLHLNTDAVCVDRLTRGGVGVNLELRGAMKGVLMLP